MTSLSKTELEIAKNRRDAAKGAMKFFSKGFFEVGGIMTVSSTNNAFDHLSKSKKVEFSKGRNDYQSPTYDTETYKYDPKAKAHKTDPDFLHYLLNGKIYPTDDGITPQHSVFRVLDSVTIEDSLMGSVSQTMRTGLGNCDEKGRIVYASLIGNPRLTDGKSQVTLVSSNETAQVKKKVTQRDDNGKKYKEEILVDKEVGYDHVFIVVADIPITNWVMIKSLGPTTMVVDGWTQDWYFPNLGLFDTKYYGLGNVPNARQMVVRKNVMNNRTRAYAGGQLKDGVSKHQKTLPKGVQFT